jgi:hypothetical protein
MGSIEVPGPPGLRSGLRTGAPCFPRGPGWVMERRHQGGLAPLQTSLAMASDGFSNVICSSVWSCVVVVVQCSSVVV